MQAHSGADQSNWAEQQLSKWGNLSPVQSKLECNCSEKIIQPWIALTAGSEPNMLYILRCWLQKQADKLSHKKQDRALAL